MHDARDQKQVSTYLAERGWIIKQDGEGYLLMDRGHILRRGAATEPIRIIEFAKYAIDLSRFEAKEQGPDLKPRERYFQELVNPSVDDDVARLQPGLLKAELHERLSSPLYPFAFVLLAVAFVGQAQTTRQNRVKAIIAAFLLSAGARLGGLAATNLVALKPSMFWIVYSIPLSAMVVAVVIAQAGMRPRRRSRLGLALARWAGGLSDAFQNLRQNRRLAGTRGRS